MSTEPEQTPLQALIRELGLHMDIDFVPRSKTDNAAETDVNKMKINWRYRVYREKHRTELTGPYSAGVGHLPKGLAPSGSVTVDQHDAIVRMLEHGNAQYFRNRRYELKKPTITDVLYCLVQDGSAIDSPTFENWAGDDGYDTDSRKAEQIYRACLEIGLKLRAMLGDENLAKLREAYQDY